MPVRGGSVNRDIARCWQAPEMGLDQRKERPRFSESIAADSEISFPLCGNYTLGELPSSSGKAGQEFFLVCSLRHGWFMRLMSQASLPWHDPVYCNLSLKQCYYGVS